MLNHFKNVIWVNDTLTLADNLNFHFGIKIHPAHNPTQSVFAVVYKKAHQVVCIYFRIENVSQIRAS